MGNVARMSGVPWHEESIRRLEGDERRHSHRCVYYDKSNGGYCSWLMENCVGATHCSWYEEVERPQVEKEVVTNDTRKKKKAKLPNQIQLEQIQRDCKYKVNMQVEHKTKGKGIILAVTNHIIVKTDDDDLLKLSTDFCLLHPDILKIL